jgi:hypothetical protein
MTTPSIEEDEAADEELVEWLLSLSEEPEPKELGGLGGRTFGFLIAFAVVGC